MFAPVNDAVFLRSYYDSDEIRRVLACSRRITHSPDITRSILVRVMLFQFNGQHEVATHIDPGMKHGLSFVLDISGALKERHYRYGKPHGKHIERDYKGRIEEVSRYRHGYLHGTRYYISPLYIHIFERWENGLRHGKERQFSSEWRLMEATRYNHDHKVWCRTWSRHTGYPLRRTEYWQTTRNIRLEVTYDLAHPLRVESRCEYNESGVMHGTQYFTSWRWRKQPVVVQYRDGVMVGDAIPWPS